MKHVTIYTDGGASPNPGNGGWGAVVLDSDTVISELFGGEKDTSNNRMELTAAIEALNSLDAGSSVDIYTDSNYVKGGITSWITSWKSNGWKTAARKPVKNQDLWVKLDEAVARHQVSWHWVKGHAGDTWNEHVDGLVAKARDSL